MLPIFSRKTWTCIGGCTALLVAAAGAYAWYRALPPAPDGDPTRIVAFAATEKFAQLPSERKQPYLDVMSADPMKFMQAARDSKLSDEQRREAMGNFFMARAQAEADKYFALPLDQRDAYLDKLLDEMDQRRAQWAGRGGGQRPAGEARPGGGPGREGFGPGGGGGRGGWGSPERMKNRMEKIPPGTRAKMAELRKALRDRRAARGR